MIQGHVIFKNRSLVNKALVRFQLIMALFRCGHHGNGSLVANIVDGFSISKGIVDLYTNKVIMVILSLEKNVMCLPSEF
jgi:hypothetical protein